MTDLIVLCEGQTEREFCRSVIAPYVAAQGVALGGTLVGKPQRKRGGIRPWQVYRAELLRLGKERADRHLAVLVDYYGMPDSWPGRADAHTMPVAQRGMHVEQSLCNDLKEELSGRFRPCVQLHEFESLLFVDPATTALSIAVGTGKPHHVLVAQHMNEMKAECGGNVEEINDSPEKSPSKRLIDLIDGYDKVAWGVTAVADVAIALLRDGCPWLGRWLNRIGSVGRSNG